MSTSGTDEYEFKLLKMNGVYVSKFFENHNLLLKVS